MFGGDKKADCPFWRGPCKEHGCRFYTHIVGTCPNTGKPIDHWDCAIAWLPKLLIENSQQQRQTGAAVESFRNEMSRQNQRLQTILIAPPMPGGDEHG